MKIDDLDLEITGKILSLEHLLAKEESKEVDKLLFEKTISVQSKIMKYINKYGISEARDKYNVLNCFGKLNLLYNKEFMNFYENISAQVLYGEK